MSSRDDLLTPSLQDAGGEFRQIHSTSTLFCCAFFGGPFGVIAMSAWNSVLLRRKMDAIPLALALVLSIAFFIMLYGRGLPGMQIQDGDEGLSRVVLRVFALALFGAFWWLHRRFYRALAVSSIPSPSGILPGILFIVLGVALQVVFARWLMS